MALPNIAGYLASTRQPLDIVGPAIKAFTDVSAEMRATRAQNLAEEKHATERGDQIKEGLQQDRMFEEKLIDLHQMRDFRGQDQEMAVAKFAMDMREREFEYQNLLPLEVQSRELGIARKQQLFNATAMEMQTEQHLRSIGVENLGLIGGLMNGDMPVPEEAVDFDRGETVDSPAARARAASRQLDALSPLIKSTGDRGLAVQYQNYRRILESDPDYQTLKSRNGLMLPAERTEQRDSRLRTFRSMLPWDDAGSAGFIERNYDAVSTMLDAPDADFGMISKRLLDRAEDERKAANMGPDTRVDMVGQRNRYDEIAKARADVAAKQAAFNSMKESGRSSMLQSVEAELREAEARERSLRESFGGLVPGVSSPSSPSASGGTSIEDFYK